MLIWIGDAKQAQKDGQYKAKRVAEYKSVLDKLEETLFRHHLVARWILLAVAVEGSVGWFADWSVSESMSQVQALTRRVVLFLPELDQRPQSYSFSPSASWLGGPQVTRRAVPAIGATAVFVVTPVAHR